jgi:hypothetical protein
MAKRDAGSWAAIVVEAESAGVPHAEIARKHGVSLAALKYHIYKSRRGDASAGSEARVLPVRVRAETAAVEAEFGAVRVRFRDGCDPAYVAAVLAALGKC